MESRPGAFPVKRVAGNGDVRYSMSVPIQSENEGGTAENLIPSFDGLRFIFLEGVFSMPDSKTMATVYDPTTVESKWYE